MGIHYVAYSSVVIAFLCCGLSRAAAQTADAQALREEIDQLRKGTCGHTKALRRSNHRPGGAPERPGADPRRTRPAGPNAGAGRRVPAGAAGAGGPTGSLPIYGAATAASKIFNPDIAVIGDFLGAAGHNEVNPSPTFEMHETEASLQAIVDPYARGDFFLAFGQEGRRPRRGFITFPSSPVGCW